MPKNIEVSLEVFGQKRLARVFSPEELSGRSVGQVVDDIVNRTRWEGEDARTLAIVKREMDSSGGYTPQVGFGGENLPVKFEPVRIGDPLTDYVQHTRKPLDQVRVTVLGDHTVGNYK